MSAVAVTPPPDLTMLLAETRWLRGLARRLCAAGLDADDLAQDTLRAAIERPPATDRPVRAWLATVLRDRLRDALRARRTRAARERLFARAEALPAAADVVAKVEVQRQLVTAVLALAEPYRTTVLLRFFDGLPPRAIAARTGAPVATVHSRLQRALQQLRSQLDAAQPRDRWLLALAPLARPRAAAGTLLLGASLVNLGTKLAVTALVGAIAWTLWANSTVAPPAMPRDDAAAPAPVTPAAAAVGAPHQPTEPAGAATQRIAVAGGTDAATAAGRLLRGRVVDASGRGLAGLRLLFEPRGAAAVPFASGIDGTFAAVPPPAASAVVADDARWATVLAGAASIADDRTSIVLVAPRIDLGGRVVDERGAPLAGAEIAVRLPSHFGADLGLLLDQSLHRSWSTFSDAQGAFALTGVPAVQHARLHTVLGGYLPRIDDLPAGSDGALVLALARPGPSATTVRGVVLDAFGATVAGARVGAGRELAHTDERGEFVLDVGRDVLPRLAVVAIGWQAEVFTPPRAASGKPQWPERVVLQLQRAPVAVHGRVVDSQRRPLAGIRVWIADPLLVGQEDDMLLAETLLARPDAPPEQRAFWSFALTDSAGAFTLAGLSARVYTLRALDPATLAFTERGADAGGSDGAAVELVLDQPLLPRLRGRVVARDGTGLAGIHVNLQRPALEVAVPGGTRDQWASATPVVTDENGAFELQRVPRSGVEVFASGDAIMFAGRMLTADDDPDAFTLQVDRRVHLQVELLPPQDRADVVRVLDAKGQPMLLRVMRGATAMTNRLARFADGRTEILSLGEDAAAVAIYRGDVEVARTPVRLLPGPVNSVRL